jgi:molybdate/tungstate transport system permease protein
VIARSRWIGRAGIGAFTLALLYPLAALFAPVGRWDWSPQVAGPSIDSVRTSIGLSAFAMLIVVAIGTPVGLYLARCARRERVWWQAALLASILLPPLALGILLSIAFGPAAPLGAALARIGVGTTNTATAFVATQVYVSIGYYVLGAIAAFEGVPRALEAQAALLGHAPWDVFRRITFPLARLGLAVALSIAWVRAIGELGAVLITAYHPSGMAVQLWVNLQSFGLPAVMPLLVIFLAATLPLPWLAHVLAQRRARA